MKKLFIGAGVVLLLSLALPEQRAFKLKLPGLKFSQVRKASGPAPAEPLSVIQPPQVQARELSLVTSSELAAAAAWSAEEIAQAVERIALADVPAALTALAPEAGGAAMEQRKLLVRRWAESDPAAAAQWAQQFPEGDLRNALFQQVAAAWANADLPGATDWLNTLPEGASQQTAAVATAYEAARTEPVTALSLAAQLPPTPERNELLTYAASQWATENFAAATEWAGKIADAGLREEMLSAIAVAAASADAPAAATMIAGALAPGAAQTRAAVAITQRWTQIAPTEAAAWVAQFPELPLRDAAVENLVGLWVRSDAQATANWVNGLPGGSLRDSALLALAVPPTPPAVVAQ